MHANGGERIVRRSVKFSLLALLVLGVFSTAHQLFLTQPSRQPVPGTQPEPLRTSSPAAQETPALKRSKVAALGRLAPRGEVINVSAPEGDRLARLVVEEGQHVQAGAILVYLDSHAERMAERQHIASRLAEAKARLASETTYGNALIAESAIRVKQLEDLPGLDIQAQEARVRMLEADLENAQRELDRMRSLTVKNLLPPQDLERQELVVRRNQLELKAAGILLDKQRQARDLDLSLARAQLKTAQATLPKALTAIEVESLRESLAFAEARLERSVIRAPVNGQILKILSRMGEATATRPILQMGDTATMYAVAEVYETDIGLVRPAQRARITSAALPRPLTGTVTDIARIVAKNVILDIDPAAAADRRVVEVKIRLDESEPAAQLINLQVEVEIQVGER